MVGNKQSSVGRQIHLPLGRAIQISMKSLKIRFWRSLITAASIFLGIAFLASVLAQQALQAPPVPIEKVYPKVFVRGMVARSLDKLVEPGISVKSVIQEAGGYAEGADQSSVTVVKVKGDNVTLDFTNPATPDARLAKGDLVFVPSAAGRLRQLIVVVIAIGLMAVGLLFALRAPEKRQRIIRSAAVVVVGLLILVVGMKNSGLSHPRAPTITVVQSYHVRGEVNVALDAPAGKGQALSKALEMSALTKPADRKHILVMRRDKTKIDVDLSTAVGRETANTTMLHAGDLVFVPNASSRNRQLWLVVMSLLVCTIGITNGMLMSVTERFKEIGTMKCLGALDKFVVELFLLESTFLGIVSSLAGWVIGFGMVALAAGLSQGFDILLQLTTADYFRMLGISVGAGALLTTIATIAPAIRAAQMPPAAALRVEI